MIIPFIASVIRDVFEVTPTLLKESAYGVGSTTWEVVWNITRIAGETAPLLFTALSNQFWILDLNKPKTNLPVTIFKFAMNLFKAWQELAWAGVFLITLGVLGLNIAARFFFRAKHN